MTNQTSHSKTSFTDQDRQQEDNVSVINNDSTTTTQNDEDFQCYENFTVYHPIFEAAQFWIEGIIN